MSWEKNILKEFDEDRYKILLGGYCHFEDGGNGGYDFDDVLKFIKNFIKQALKQQKKGLEKLHLQALEEEYEKGKQNKAPMGVSQWKEYGKKYKYWEFFEKKQKEEFMEGVES